MSEDPLDEFTEPPATASHAPASSNASSNAASARAEETQTAATEAETETVSVSQVIPPLTPVRQFGAPRRFGIGTILVVMAVASLLLAFLIAWGAPAVVVLHVAGFTTLIGFAQVFLFQGTNPRRASLVAGFVICPIYMLGWCVFLSVNQTVGRMRGIRGDDLICATFSSLAFGPLLGYLAGGIVGGIFLMMDAWEKKFGRQDHATRLYDPFAPEPVEAEIPPDDEVFIARRAEPSPPE